MSHFSCDFIGFSNSTLRASLFILFALSIHSRLYRDTDTKFVNKKCRRLYFNILNGLNRAMLVSVNRILAGVLIN